MASAEDEYKKLRAFLNPAIRGEKVDAILKSIAVASKHLTEISENVGDQIYISRAEGRYLDQRLADYGLVRPGAVGLSDDVFREIGIAVVARKQVRDLIMSLLTIMFGEEATQATSKSSRFEPYALRDGDTLKVQFDSSPEAVVTFAASDFQNIGTATAQEVADAITKSLRSQGLTGRAFAKDDGNGAFVTLISDTEGPSSSVIVQGGRAQNELVFDKPRATQNGPDTQWTCETANGSNVRFTWTAGSNPFLGKVRRGDYVNIYGTAFDVDNRGTFKILDAQGGVAGTAYFEIENPNGVAQVVVQGTVDALLFFQPLKQTLSTKNRFAAVYQEEARLLEVFIPATTKVVRRNRIGAAHIHGEAEFVTTTYVDGQNYVFDATVPAAASISDGQYFTLSTALDVEQYYAYFDTTGADLVDLAPPGLTGIRVDISGATTPNEVALALADALMGAGFGVATPPAATVRVANIDVGTATAASNINVAGLSIATYQVGVDSDVVTTTTPNPDNTSVNNLGPYIYDIEQPFTISHIGTLSSAKVAPGTGRVIGVVDATAFPDAMGNLILGYGTSHQEGPIPYLSRPSSNTLIISPAYAVENTHLAGTDVALVARNAPVEISTDGSDTPFYITDVVAGRVYAEDLVNLVAATGIQVAITIIYPSDIGLSKWGTADSDKVRVWGE